MGLLQEAKNIADKMVLRAIGITYLPKRDIMSMRGGDHATNQDGMYLVSEVSDPAGTRNVNVYKSPRPNQFLGKGQEFFEFVSEKHQGERVEVFKR